MPKPLKPPKPPKPPGGGNPHNGNGCDNPVPELLEGIRDVLRALLEVIRQLVKPPPQPQVRFWTVTFEPDEPMPTHKHMKLTKPIKPGFRRPFTITPDEPVDVNANGTYVMVEIVSGDSTVTIDPASTATSIKGWLNGDGAIGAKAVRFVADGHIGEGEVQVTLDIEYDVANPDATSLTFAEGADEPIPT